MPKRLVFIILLNKFNKPKITLIITNLNALKINFTNLLDFDEKFKFIILTF